MNERIGRCTCPNCEAPIESCGACGATFSAYEVNHSQRVTTGHQGVERDTEMVAELLADRMAAPRATDVHRSMARAVLKLIPPQRCAPSREELLPELDHRFGLTRTQAILLTNSILAIFAAQPTVEQAKAEALWEAADELEAIVSRAAVTASAHTCHQRQCKCGNPDQEQIYRLAVDVIRDELRVRARRIEADHG